MNSVACMDEGDRQISIISTVVSRNRYSLTHFPGAPFSETSSLKSRSGIVIYPFKSFSELIWSKENRQLPLFVNFVVDRDSRLVKQR